VLPTGTGEHEPRPGTRFHPCADEESRRFRIHPIITKGGDAVSVVPAEVHLETFVRGGSLDAIVDANMKVDRCLRAGAMAMGAEVEINTIPGYLPQRNDRQMGELFGGNV
jgi:metal-dependent amidase/aminoacylase/carboxypeptidase family protein